MSKELKKILLALSDILLFCITKKILKIFENIEIDNYVVLFSIHANILFK